MSLITIQTDLTEASLKVIHSCCANNVLCVTYILLWNISLVDDNVTVLDLSTGSFVPLRSVAYYYSVVVAFMDIHALLIHNRYQTVTTR